MVTDLFTIPLAAGDSVAGELLFGQENRLAIVAAEKLAEDVRAISPLVLYGPSGVGKTHLALGLAARWREEYPDQRVTVVTGADYARQYADACKADAVEDFARPLRKSDLLVVDTLCELAGKSAAQQHLSSTLDVIHGRGGTVIVTLRHFPGERKTMLATLASRLLGGLAIEMSLPDAATRQAIALHRAKHLDVRLEDDAARFLAGRISGGVSQIHSTVAQLASQYDKNITRNDVEELLGPQQPAEVPTLATIAAVTARRFHVKLKDLRGPSRRRAHVRARGVAMLAARRLAEMPYGRIGAYFGGRDHTTVMHACRKTEELLAVDEQLANMWKQIAGQVS